MASIRLTPRDWEALGEAFLFRGFGRDEIAGFLHRANLARFPAGAAISAPGDFRRSLGIILSGSAAVRKRADGGAMLISILERGAIFGAATLFGAPDPPTEIHAQSPVRAILIGEAALTAMLREDFRLTERYLAYLTGRIHFLNRRLDGFLCPTAEGRLLQFLARNADEEGRVRLGFSFTALAEALCVSRASLYRAMDNLQREGRLRREGKRTLLLTP